jgi:hypothetical protein
VSEEKIVKIRVPIDHGCENCHYACAALCSHPDVPNRKCSKRDHFGAKEYIYLTEDKAALARLRGTYG